MRSKPYTPTVIAVECPKCTKGKLQRCVDEWGIERRVPHAVRVKKADETQCNAASTTS